MVFVLDGNSEIHAYAWSDLGYLICLHRSRVVTNTIFLSEMRNLYFEIPSCVNRALLGSPARNYN